MKQLKNFMVLGSKSHIPKPIRVKLDRTKCKQVAHAGQKSRNLRPRNPESLGQVNYIALLCALHMPVSCKSANWVQARNTTYSHTVITDHSLTSQTIKVLQHQGLLCGITTV